MTDIFLHTKNQGVAKSHDEPNDDRCWSHSKTDLAEFEEGTAVASPVFSKFDAGTGGDFPTKAQQGGAQTKTTQSAFAFVPVGDLQYRAPEYIVEDLFETETLGLIFGDPGCGKSFLAVDLALSVASGTRFHGRAVRQGSVFFIAGEGHNGLARRFAAWSKARDVPLAGVPMFKSERAAQFLDGASAKAVADAVELRDGSAPAPIAHAAE